MHSLFIFLGVELQWNKKPLDINTLDSLLVYMKSGNLISRYCITRKMNIHTLTHMRPHAHSWFLGLTTQKSSITLCNDHLLAKSKGTPISLQLIYNLLLTESTAAIHRGL